MAKKCIPGVVCIENMTLFMLFVILALMVHFYYIHFNKNADRGGANERKIRNVNEGSLNIFRSNAEEYESRVELTRVPSYGMGGLSPIPTRRDPFNDPYAPPLQDATGFIYPRGFQDIRGVIPINMETQGLGTQYQQLGILERADGSPGQSGDLILPLMGRRSMIGRDKWQYYTISNTGTLNTKLPITYQGRSCTSENGCDSLNNGDEVYVKGYNNKFRATVYENNLLQYIPY